MSQLNSPLAFHGNPALKAEYIARYKANLTDRSQSLKVWGELVDLGIPKWLVCAGEIYARNMSPTWSLEFLHAARVGADFDLIKGPFLVFVLRCAREKVLSRYADVLAAVDRSIALWERPDIHSPDWLNEAKAVEAAAWTAAAGADARPPWNAAKTAARAAVAATFAPAVAETVREASATASRAGYGYDSDGIAHELLRLMGTQ